MNLARKIMLTCLLVLGIASMSGCTRAAQAGTISPQDWIIIPEPNLEWMPPPIPKSFFERVFPHATPIWPSNRSPRYDAWEKSPLLVV